MGFAMHHVAFSVLLGLSFFFAASLTSGPSHARVVVEILEPGRPDSAALVALLELQQVASSRPTGRVRVILGLRSSSLDPSREEIAAVRTRLLNDVSGTLRSQLALGRAYSNFALLSTSLNTDELSAIVLNEQVRFIEQEAEDGTVLLTDVIPLLNADEVHSNGIDGSGQVIAIVDSGVKSDAIGLSGKVVSEGCFSTPNGTHGSYCFGGVGYGVTTAGSGREGVAGSYRLHGTHVAGPAVANNLAGYGVAKGASLISLQVLSYDDLGNERILETDLIGALDRVVDLSSTYNIAAVNMSISISGATWHSSTCDAAYPGVVEAIGELVDRNIAVVAAAGNGAVLGMVSPACISDVISVTGVTKSDDPWSDSPASPATKLMAVSGAWGGGSNDIHTTGYSGYTGANPGTSLAAPQVSGAIAVLRDVAPGGSVLDYLDQLTSTGVVKTVVRGGTTFHIPRIDVEAAAETPSVPSTHAVTRDLCYGSNQSSWGSSSGPVTHYTLEGSASASFTGALVYYSGPSTSAIYSVSGTTYMRVRACNGIVCSTNKLGSKTATYTAGCM